jgi:hypothetical protein
MLVAVIHVAIGLLAVSLTCLFLAVVSYFAPGVRHAGLPFAAGSYVSTGLSLAFTAFVVNERL